MSSYTQPCYFSKYDTVKQIRKIPLKCVRCTLALQCANLNSPGDKIQNKDLLILDFMFYSSQVGSFISSEIQE